MGLFRKLLAYVCQFVYWLIAWIYELFINISRVEILSSDDIAPIYQRFTLILAIIMVFYITFEFVKFVVEPDGIVDKEKGAQKTVFKMVLVVIMIAFVPTIFSKAYQLQNIIFDNQLFSKIILGKQDVKMADMGKDFSANVLSMFYYIDDEIKWKNENKGKKCGDLECKQIVSLNLDYMRTYGKLPYLTMGLDEEAKAIEPDTEEKVDEFKINFNGLFAILVGCFVVYMLVLYCIDAGVRVAQLTFLQIIAPIPIIGYLSPKKEGLFQKWLKQCTTTYIDLFLRVGIIYFVLLLSQILTKALTDGTILEHATTKDETMKTFMFIAIIMGLLLFAKKAPELIKELFPNTSAAAGNFGLKAGDRVAPLAARAIGGALGATRAVGGAIARAHNRNIRNKANGHKSRLTKEGREQAKQQREERKAHRAAASNATSARKRAEQIDAKRDAFREQIKDKIAERDAAKTERKAAEAHLEKVRNNKNATAEERQAAEARFNTAKAREAKIQGEINAAAKKTASEVHDIKMGDAAYRAQYEARQQVRGNWSQEEDALRRANAAYQTAKENGASEEELERLEKARNTAQAAFTDKVQEGREAVDEATGKTGAEIMREEQDYGRQIADVAAAEVTEQKAKDQVIEDKNTKYRSVMAAGAWGALAGGATGAYHGAQATKLEEIGDKIKEGVNKDIENIHAVDKYYDDGGTGFINRTLTSIEKKIGMDTAYTATNLRTKSLESTVKKQDGTISVADNAKKSFDTVEDRLKSKLPESKYVGTGTEQIKTGVAIADENGEMVTSLTLGANENIAQFSRKWKGKATAKRAEADQASKLVTERKDELAQLSRNISAQNEDISTLRSKAPHSLTDEERARIEQFERLEKEKAEKEAALKELEKDAAKKNQEATDLEFACTQIDKNAARLIFTKMLTGEIDPEQVDAVAKEALETQLNDIKIATQEPAIVEYISSHHPDIYSAFMQGKFSDYDQLDKVISAITNAKNAVARERQVSQAEITRNNTSARTEAQKAANDYKGGN